MSRTLPYLAALIIGFSVTCQADSAPNAIYQEVSLDGTPSSLTITDPAIEYVIFEGSTSSRDTQPLTALFEAPEGAVAYIQAHQVSKIGHSRRTKAFRPWRMSLVDSEGIETSTINKTTPSTDSDLSIGFGTGLLHIDACARRAKTKIQFVVDLTTVADRPATFTIQGALFLKVSPQGQQTLLKYPSEKNASQAVLIMRRSLQPTLVNFVRWRNGRPINAGIITEPGLYISHAMTYTRMYLSRAQLNGSFVTIEAHESGFGGSYGVCAQLSGRRQELEGY